MHFDSTPCEKDHMFTMAKIRDGSTYLSRHLISNDYYCEKESLQGKWLGRGADRLNLHNQIAAGDQAFEALRANKHPMTGERLTPRDREDRIRFFDFQCSAQKSVSIMAVTFGDERLLMAHDEAARIAFTELEQFAATQANTPLERQTRLTGNVVAATFRHTASRALDPQVHTHHVIANATWDEQTQSWRALTEFEMLKAIRYAGKVYQNEMALACQRLGYGTEITKDAKGRISGFEIKGVSHEIRERFSKRRAEVEEGIKRFHSQTGRLPTPAETHVITVSTRDPKLKEITTPEVLQAQLAQLSKEEKDALTELKDASLRPTASTRDTPAWRSTERSSLTYAIGHLFERRSVATGHEILADALNVSLGRVLLATLKKQAERAPLKQTSASPWLHSTHVTPKGLLQERWAIDFVTHSKGQHSAIVQASLPALPGLSEEQSEAVRKVLQSKDQVICLRGAAGVGKSTMVKAMQPVLAEGGHNIFFCAPTSSAAETLRTEGISQATTVSDFLKNVAIRSRKELQNAILFVDEAGLASNNQGTELLKIAQQTRAKVIFLGDSRQHSSVEAGDFLRILETHSPIERVEVTDIRRQQHTAYRCAVKTMALGASKAGLEQLEQLGWVHEGRDQYIKNAVDTYTAHLETSKDFQQVLAVAPTWAENHSFTRELRSQLKAKAFLGVGEPVLCHQSLQWTQAQKQQASHYIPGMVIKATTRIKGFESKRGYEVSKIHDQKVWVHTPGGECAFPIHTGSFDVVQAERKEVCPGERILILANDRGQNLINGEILTVQSIQAGRIQSVEGKSVDTANFCALGYGYAVTSHKSQSKTVDHVVVVAERLDAKSAYVACSRGRKSCTIHTPDRENLLRRVPEGNRKAALEALEEARGSQARNPKAEHQESSGSLSQRSPSKQWLRHRTLAKWMQGMRNWWERIRTGHSVDNTAMDKRRINDRSFQ